MTWASLCSALDWTGFNASVLALRRRTATPWLTVLSYHRVTPPGGGHALDPEVELSSAVLDRQLAIATRAFDVIGLDEVLGILRGARPPPSPLLITFDDGYRDNYDVALPLLRKHGARAVFFVATAYIQERRLFWWDRICLTLATTPRDVIELRYPYPLTLQLGPGSGGRAAARATVLRVVKTCYGLDLPRFLDHLATAAHVHLDRARERHLADEHIMTWDHVRALRDAGMDVQSHTSTHRVLQTLPRGQLVAELRDSRQLLEDVLGQPVRAVSYPVGRAPRYSPAIRAAVREAGYGVGFSNRGGVNLWRDFDALDIKRVSPECAVRDAEIRAVLAVPSLAY